MPYILLALGLAMMIVSGNLLVTGGVQLARHFKISTFIVGLTIVAFSTSAPEVFISVGSALSGAHDIALGNVIGSNIANISFIFAVAVLVFPVPVRDKAVLFDLSVMFLVTLLLFIFGLNGLISRIEGLFLMAILVSYTVVAIAKSRKKLSGEKIPEPTIKPALAALMIAAAIAGLYFASDWFVEGARGVALQWGVSERVIAISIVAVGTSMPELISSIIAGLKKETDISIGTIIGSNIMNVTGVLGLAAVVRPLNITSLALFRIDMLWLFGISAALLLAMLPFSKGIVSRAEGAGLLALFSVYMFVLFT